MKTAFQRIFRSLIKRSGLQRLKPKPPTRNAVYVVIRYSVLLKKKGYWKKSVQRDSFEEYKSQLFDKNRLQSRYQLFTRITLPSLTSQKNVPQDVNYKIILLVSDQLPEEHRAILDELEKAYAEIVLVPVSESFSSYSTVIRRQLKRDYNGRGHVRLATVRVDDDDAVSRDFLARLIPYMCPAFNGMGISFGNGYIAYYSKDTERITQLKHYYYPKLALGLAHINTVDLETEQFLSSPYHVYALGSHVECDKHCPVILDSTTKSFIRVVHAESDTSEYWSKKMEKYKKVEDVAILRNVFCIDENIYDDRLYH